MPTNDKLKPSYKCGGKLHPVNSDDAALNALYCNDCRTIHMLNDVYVSMDATIKQYNRLYDELTGANYAD